MTGQLGSRLNQAGSVNSRFVYLAMWWYIRFIRGPVSISPKKKILRKPSALRDTNTRTPLSRQIFSFHFWIGALHPTKEYFTYAIPASVMKGGSVALPKGKPATIRWLQGFLPTYTLAFKAFVGVGHDRCSGENELHSSKLPGTWSRIYASL